MSHVVETEHEAGRYYWTCSCGAGGSVSDERDPDLASDRHIEANEERTDRSRA